MFGLGHSEDVKSAVHADDLARRAGPRSRAEPDRRAAHRLERGVGAQGGVHVGVLVGLAGTANGSSGQRLHRSGRDGVDANPLGAEVIGEITRRGFERGLCHAHHVVVRHDPLRALIGQGQEGSAVLDHQRGGRRR